MSTTNVTSLFIQPGTLNVGIGTSQPRAKLEVAGSIVPSSNVEYDLGSATLRWRDLYLSGNSINLGGTTISRDATTGGIKFIDPATNQPLDSTVRNLTASNLTVLGDYVTLNTITSNTEQMVIQNAGTGPALKVTQTGAHPIADFYDDNNVLAMRIADGGNVGIGTANPQYKLDVNGNIYASGDVIMFSDARKKTNVEVIPSALEKVLRIHGVTFEKLDGTEETQRRHAGVIAQEVEEVLPEVVYTAADGTKSVAYGNMIGLLIEAIKDLAGR